MKPARMIRRLDGFGRIVLPEALRAQLGIEEGAELEFYSSGDAIVLSRFMRGCVFCGLPRRIIMFRGQHVCKNCIIEMLDHAAEKRSRNMSGEASTK